jgi:hypothetical protein
MAYGYQKLGRPKPDEKPDQFIGKIYTMTSCFVEINRLKKELERAKTVNAEDEFKELTRQLDDWVAVAAELKQKYPQLFEELLTKIGENENPETAIKIINQAYEAGDKKSQTPRQNSQRNVPRRLQRNTRKNRRNTRFLGLGRRPILERTRRRSP